MKLYKLLVLIFILSNLNLLSQTKLDFIQMVRGDSLGIMISRQLNEGELLNIFRKDAEAASEFELVNKNGFITPLIEPDEIKTAVGNDWKLLEQAFRTDDDFEIMRQLKNNEFSSGVLSLLSSDIAISTGRFFWDSGITVGKEYIYKLVYYNDNRKPIDSLEKRLKAIEILPNAPTELTSETGDFKITLKWKYPKWDGTFNDIGSYFLVFRKNMKSSQFEVITDNRILRDDENSPEYEDIFLENNKEYEYYVVAVDAIGRMSKPSNTIKTILKDITPPLTPENFKVTSGEGKNLLSWTISLELDAAGYNVYRSEGLDKPLTKLNRTIVKVSDPYWSDSTAVNGIQYFYCVTSVDADSNESQATSKLAGLSFDNTPPEKLKEIKTKISEGEVKIFWKSVNSKDIAGYYIYRGETKEIIPRITHEYINDTFFVDKGYKEKGLKAGGKYIYAVTSVDKSNNESEKAFIEIVIPDNEAPQPPNNFYVKNNDGIYAEVFCGNSPSLDAERYVVYRFEDGKPTKTDSLFTSVKAPFSFRDTGLIKGRKYIYYSNAIDTAGNISQSSQKDTIIFRDFTAPPATRYCRASVKNSGIELEWERVIDFDFEGFNIYRSSLPNGNYQKLNDTIVKEVKFFDKSGNTEYFYKIGSVDSSGNEKLSVEVKAEK